MSDRDYSTRRGALLAAMEHNCEQPGLWLVEGYQVRQLQSSISYGAMRIRPWLVIDGDDTKRFPSFERALEHIASIMQLDV